MRCRVLFRGAVIGEADLARPAAPPWADPRQPGAAWRQGRFTPTPLYEAALADACAGRFGGSFATFTAQVAGMLALDLRLATPAGAPLAVRAVVIQDLRAAFAAVDPADAADPDLLVVLALLEADAPTPTMPTARPPEPAT
jgi:hypothetical protein